MRAPSAAQADLGISGAWSGPRFRARACLIGKSDVRRPRESGDPGRSCRKGTLYIGVTSDLAFRIWQHRSNAVAGFVQNYRVRRLGREGRLKQFVLDFGRDTGAVVAPGFRPSRPGTDETITRG